jgi:hypothetical protein
MDLISFFLLYNFNIKKNLELIFVFNKIKNPLNISQINLRKNGQG